MLEHITAQYSVLKSFSLNRSNSHPMSLHLKKQFHYRIRHMTSSENMKHYRFFFLKLLCSVKDKHPSTRLYSYPYKQSLNIHKPFTSFATKVYKSITPVWAFFFNRVERISFMPSFLFSFLFVSRLQPPKDSSWQFFHCQTRLCTTVLAVQPADPARFGTSSSSLWEQVTNCVYIDISVSHII